MEKRRKEEYGFFMHAYAYWVCKLKKNMKVVFPRTTLEVILNEHIGIYFFVNEHIGIYFFVNEHIGIFFPM